MDTVFFWVSKLVWLIISPDSLLLILVLAALIFLLNGKQQFSKHLLSIACGLLLIIAFFPVGEWLLYPLETRFETNPVLPKKINGIIVLSGAEDPLLSHLWNQAELGGAAERDLSFLALARQHPEAKLIFTGGAGSLINQDYKAADVAKKLFEQQGFDVARIIFERESRNTYENAIFSKKIALVKKNETWVLITTAWHMPRSVGIFCKAAWPVIPYPVDHQTMRNNLFRIDFDLSNNLNYLKISIKEWLGLFAYRISNKTNKLFPNQC